ncbi:MAG: Stk1 family PASTA domain-containing Ser/Thr kinase [Bacilli bacterium]|nr:Stk1 family PASTA domain-containing Ser/Thr kinase [Bacilli bacterium]
MIAKGQKINDRYEVKALIGEGGMANVYLGYDTILGRDVAIKVLRGDLADDEKFVRRFRREAQSASLLNHPNIVQIYDVGEDDGNFYIVMEYINGQTLKQIIKKRKRLSISETIDIMCQLTDGLSSAHDSYIIHRDIKPQNIMILDDGMVKITDFGIAMAVNASDLTQTNSVMGSVHYLPPEQASGRGSTIKSDIYSLGIMLYEMLAGTMPFRGETAVEIAMKHLKSPMPSIRKLRDDVPQSLENIILKAAAKNPKNRYNNVRELYDDLKTCLDEQRKDEKRIVFKYPENEYDDEKTVITNNLKEEIKKKEEEKEERKKIEVKEIEESIEDKRMSKFTKLLIILVSVLVFALLAVFIIFPAVFKNPSIEVPDVSGLSVKEARTLLKNEGLKISGTIKEDYTDDVEAGKVTKTNPKAGSVVKKGAVITLYKSLGSNRIELKDYTGEEAEKIKWDLDKEGINVIIEKKDVDNKSDYLDKADIIIAQEPAAGEKIISGDILKLYIPNIITAYPNFVEDSKYKSSIDKIQAFCDEYDINLTVKEVETEEKAAGTILSQSISEGSKINKGDKITVELAKKPVELVPIEGESENSNEQNNQDN